MDEEDRYTRITLRLPKDLDRKLQENADATSKSKNAEIIQRLEQSFALPGAGSAEAMVLAARLNSDLVLARYEEHQRDIEAEKVADYLNELLREIDKRGLTDELERIVYGFDELVKLAESPRMASKDRIAITKKRALELVDALAQMESATERLLEQCPPPAAKAKPALTASDDKASTKSRFDDRANTRSSKNSRP